MTHPQQLVLDASACISLLATRVKTRILNAIPGRKLVPYHAAREVNRDPSNDARMKSSAAPLHRYFEEGTLEETELTLDEQSTFVELVGAEPPDDLGDGEAAALACGHHRAATVVVDDGKAMRVSRERFPSVRVIPTVELLRRSDVLDCLGDEFDDALLNALVYGRMRVPPDHDDWVRKRLGPERAGRCPSLRVRRPSPTAPARSRR